MVITRDEIMDRLQLGPVKLQDLAAEGFNKEVAMRQLSLLVLEGKAHRYGFGRQVSYTAEPKVKEVKDPARSRKVKPTLPDWPEIMLKWGGYTDHEPDPDAGEYVQGGQW